LETTLLVIEDERDHQWIIMARLMKAGYSDVKIVTSLEEGIQACKERPRDVLVVDSGVIGENLTEAVSRLRESCPNTRMVGYSAGAQKVKWADAHIAKSAPFQDLLDAIEAV
jgi:DNA-binding NtrC family response regulator